MHTNMDIDANLLREAQALGNYKTKKATVNEALAEYVRTRKRQKVLELFGTIDFAPDYDHKSERKAR